MRGSLPYSSSHQPFPVLLLLDIGHTHTHLGLADSRRILKQSNFPTAEWFDGGQATKRIRKFAGQKPLAGAILSSVVPRATPFVRGAVKRLWNVHCLELNSKTVCGIGI